MLIWVRIEFVMELIIQVEHRGDCVIKIITVQPLALFYHS